MKSEDLKAFLLDRNLSLEELRFMELDALELLFTRVSPQEASCCAQVSSVYEGNVRFLFGRESNLIKINGKLIQASHLEAFAHNKQPRET